MKECQAKRKLLPEDQDVISSAPSDSDSNASEEPILDDSEEYSEEDFRKFDPEKEFTGEVQEGDYVLTEFTTDKKERKVYYIGKVLKNKGDGQDYEISFLKPSEKMLGKFVLPNVPKIEVVEEGVIKMILPQPKFFGSTKRQQSHYSFEVEFGSIEIR